jgi:hypothetical protein
MGEGFGIRCRSSIFTSTAMSTSLTTRASSYLIWQLREHGLCDAPASRLLRWPKMKVG